ncbi:YegS/Rv2252/BmrU family lipid kinase [Stella humosa]|uniref:YegS/Rv2252/BmrU family lipid kinase n=1 Tax=Stella humosa TaxID=94 RepID=A0A3N1KV08_9PROT|nr:lipid kinase [Stella humosa]ROP83814.1 YegS/Rv2252/BmrU family lipid kinase [Stella humosa]BBK32925.1 lipid kinase [Stella humosa]
MSQRLPDGPRKALLIVNGRARNGGAALDGPKAILAEAGITLVECPCEEGTKAADAIRARASEGFTEVIVGGGDGTMNAAAPGLVATGLPLGILPLGTANDLARSLEIPTDPVEAARVIAAGRARPIDLGDVNGHLYFNVASIGFSAVLARELSSESKKRWGVLGYAITAFRLLRRMRPFSVIIGHDGGREQTKTIQVAVGNGRNYGGGMTVDADAQPDDGMLDVYSLEIDHWWRLVALAPSMRRGTHGAWSDVRTLRTKACTLTTRRPMRVNADGELVTQTPARFQVHPGAVRIFAPETVDKEAADQQPADQSAGGASAA